jgi:thymidylate kinase
MLNKNNGRGKFIVFYGINNLGKTTQAEVLIKTLNKHNIKAEYIKYPIYKLEPTGHFINKILRGGKKQNISEHELQLWYTLNRFQYEPNLENRLEKGIWVIAEDYVGTGLSWGWSKGAKLNNLEAMNSFLLKEDLAIYFFGKRFLEGKEKVHIHEQNDKLMENCQKKHSILAKKYHWQKVCANGPREEIADKILEIV